MRCLLPLALLAAGTAGAATPPEPAPSIPALAPGEARATALDLADKLESDFVDPATGKRYAAMLRAKVAAGGYDGVTDWKALTEVLTADVQAVSPDGHFKVMAGRAPPPPPGAVADAGAGPPPIERAGWIAPGVAYIRFNLFPSGPETSAAAGRFMAEHADARAIIIDIRNHSGGGLGEPDAMLPYLFAKPASLVMMDTRSAVEARFGAIIPEGPALRRVPSPPEVVRREHHVTPHPTEARLFDADAYLLTSGATASAAEHFALALKRTGRATLIGETTAGAGNFGGFAPVGRNFSAFIPIGRSFDPDTGEGWDGIGIAPDVAVPAERALAEALTRAGLAADEAERFAASVAR